MITSFHSAATGSGKTAVGEYLIAHCLAQGLRVFYTTPIKSLSNQKVRAAAIVLYLYCAHVIELLFKLYH